MISKGLIFSLQKQPCRNVLRQRCSENMQKIYRRTHMPKCNFNKVAKQFYWNNILAWVFSCKFAAYFQDIFSLEHLWLAASVLGIQVWQYSRTVTVIGCKQSYKSRKEPQKVMLYRHVVYVSKIGIAKVVINLLRKYKFSLCVLSWLPRWMNFHADLILQTKIKKNFIVINLGDTNFRILKHYEWIIFSKQVSRVSFRTRILYLYSLGKSHQESNKQK